MANSLRKRQNFILGTITNNPLAIGDTTLNAAGLASISGGVDSTHHMAIILDPLAVNGAPEVVWITALTAGATSATIVRAQESTTARSHPAGTQWIHAATARDFPAGVGSGVPGASEPETNVPWLIELPVTFGYSTKSASGVSATVGNTSDLRSPYMVYTVQNNFQTWPVVLSPGTWECEIIYNSDTNRGIASIQLDGTTVGTIDQYAAAPVQNVRGLTSSFTVTEGGKRVLQVIFATKNASSSGYVGVVQTLVLRRTA